MLWGCVLCCVFYVLVGVVFFSLQSGTFQDSSSKPFSSPPSEIRNCKDFKQFSKLLHGYILIRDFQFVIFFTCVFQNLNLIITPFLLNQECQNISQNQKCLVIQQFLCKINSIALQCSVLYCVCVFIGLLLALFVSFFSFFFVVGDHLGPFHSGQEVYCNVVQVFDTGL